MDNNGNDIKGEAVYNVVRDNTKHEVTINFYRSSWYPNDFGIVPKTYSLLASLNPDVPIGTTAAFKLTAVQLHEAGKTASLDVSGVPFEVVKIAGMTLPVITTASVSSIVAYSDIGGKAMPLASFTASCPADSYSFCELESIEYSAGGMSEPVLNIDGAYYPSSRSVYPDDVYTFNARIGYSLAPGQTKTFTVFATPYQAQMSISIPKMVWVVWGSLRVNPIIPVGQENCNMIISDKTFCKG